MLHAYLEIMKTRIRSETVYKIDYIFGFISLLVYMFVFFFLWSSIFAYNKVESIGGLTLLQIIAYMSVNFCIGRVFTTFIEFDIEDEVKYGKIASILAKPLDYRKYWFFMNSADSFLGAVTAMLPGLAIAFLFFSLTLPSSLNLAAFLISFAVAFIINFSFMFLTGIYAFWSHGSIWGMKKLLDLVSLTFSGWLIPLYLFPDWLKSIALLLPFQAMYNVPASIFIGKFSGAEMLFAIAQQIAWVIIIMLVVRVAWNRAKRKYIIQGG